MKVLAEFTKTTLVGGVLVILPVYVTILLLAKAVKGLLALPDAGTAQLPAAVQFRQLAAALLLIAVCFVVGLVVRTGPGLRAKNAFEHSVLEQLPGYTFLRGLARRLTGRSDEQMLQPALVEIEDALVPALIVEEARGRFVHRPGPLGADAHGRQPLHPAGQPLHPVDLPFAKAISVFSKWGTGAGEYVRAMRQAERPPAA